MSQQGSKSNRTLSLRLWHWFNAFVILGLLLTVLLRKTLLSWRTNSALISAKLEAAGAPITADLAKEIAVSIRNPLWDWHIYLGYGLAFLLCFRIVTSFLFEKKFVFTAFFKKIKFQSLHKNIVDVGYSIFYLATSFMVISGLILVYEDDLKITKSVAHTIEECHETTMWFFVFFIVIHIIGVVFAENKDEPGLISEMVHGRKK